MSVPVFIEIEQSEQVCVTSNIWITYASNQQSKSASVAVDWNANKFRVNRFFQKVSDNRWNDAVHTTGRVYS